MTAEAGPSRASEDADPYSLAWAGVEAMWNDREAHARFQALCAETGRLSEAGRRYRAVREADPARAEVAAEQIDKLHALALTRLSTHRGPTAPSRHWRTAIAFVVSMTIVVMALWSLLRLP